MKSHIKGLAILMTILIAIAVNACTPKDDADTSGNDTTVTTTNDDTGETTTGQEGLLVVEDTDGSNYGELHLVD